MHSFSYPFSSNPASLILKSYHSLSHENPVFQANFISSHSLIISQIPKFTETFYRDTYFQSDSHTKKRIYKRATNHPTHLIPLSYYPTITKEKEKIQNAINKRRNLNPIPIMG